MIATNILFQLIQMPRTSSLGILGETPPPPRVIIPSPTYPDHERLDYSRSYKSHKSRHSMLSAWSFCSLLSTASVFSTLSALSLLSVVSGLSILSTSSLFSFLSTNSILSVFSFNSVLSVGCDNSVLSVCTNFTWG